MIPCFIAMLNMQNKDSLKLSFGLCPRVLGDDFAIVNKTAAVTGIETPIASHTCHLNGFRKTYI